MSCCLFTLMQNQVTNAKSKLLPILCFKHWNFFSIMYIICAGWFWHLGVEFIFIFFGEGWFRHLNQGFLGFNTRHAQFFWWCFTNSTTFYDFLCPLIYLTFRDHFQHNSSILQACPSHLYLLCVISTMAMLPLFVYQMLVSCVMDNVEF